MYWGRKVEDAFNRLQSNHHVAKMIKCIPAVITILLVLHVGLLLCGVYEAVTVGVAGILALLLMIVLSYRFKFCRLHKAMIIYSALMTVCIVIQKYDGFGHTLTIFRSIMLVLGVILVALLIRKIRKDDGEC